MTYDCNADSAHLYIVPPFPGIAKETVPLLPEQTGGHFINLDFDAAGKLVGIEFQDASTIFARSVLDAAAQTQEAEP